MDPFSRREEGFEKAFSHEEEIRFKARARRNRLLGEWAGEKLGLSGPALDGYATGIVERGVATADDEALVADLAKALAPHEVSEHRIRRRIEQFDAEAMREIQAGR
jgi:hypothetical protein